MLSIPKNEEIVQNHQKTIEHIRNNKIKPLTEQINKIKNIPEKIIHAKNILDKTEKNHANYQSNYKLSLKLLELKKDFEISSKTKDKICKEIEENKKKLIIYI